MDHLKEMDEFLERYLTRLNQKEIEKMSRPVTSIETVTEKNPKPESPGPGVLTCEFYHGEKLSTILLKLFQKIAEEGKPPNWGNWTTTCKNEIKTLLNATHKNKLKMYLRPKCKTGNYKPPRGKHTQNSFSCKSP